MDEFESVADLTMSTKGQVCIPSAMRRDLGWPAGLKLRARRAGDQLVISRVTDIEPTELGSAFGMLPYSGRPKSIKEMKAAIHRRLMKSE